VWLCSRVLCRVALKQIGAVIRNPEISALVPALLAAISEPASNTAPAIQALITTSFVHSVTSLLISCNVTHQR